MKHLFSVWLLGFCVLLSFGLFSQGIEQFHFTENGGQWHSDINFKAGLPNGNLYLGETSFLYSLSEEEAEAKLGKLRHHHSHNDVETDEDIILNHHSVKISFLKPQQGIRRVGEIPIDKKINYLKGNDPRKWASGVKTYKRVVYYDLFKNTNWYVFNKGGALKHEFKVKKGGRAKDIKLKIEGADLVELVDQQLVIHTSVGKIIESAPYAYQGINGKRVEVECSFVLKKNVLSFKVGGYNKRYPLIIDPELIFSTLSGSTADNWGNSACVDRNGSLYGVGTVFPTTGNSNVYDLDGFPTTPGAYQDTLSADTSVANNNRFTDLAIMKYTPDGSSVEYATYLGGRECDVPTSSIVDSAGNLYILAVTSSNNLPNAVNNFVGGPSAFPGTFHYFPSGTDIAIIKLNPNGSQVLSTRYMGGSSVDGIMLDGWPLTNNYGDHFRGDINLDDDGNVYVGSVSLSSDFPTTTGALQEVHGGDLDGVVFKLGPDLDSLYWSTYLGGIFSDAVFSIYRDSKRNVFVAGGTISVDFPTTDSALYTSNQGINDGFVSRISAVGDSLIASTYLGTNQFDQAYFVQLDTNDNAYILGQTKGVYPVTTGAYGVLNGGLFIHKLTPNLDSTFFVSTLGSDNPNVNNIVPNISPTAFLVNECENMFVSGWGGDTNDGYNGGETRGMFISSFAHKGESQTDGSDFYLYVLQRDAIQPLYGSYFGGGSSSRLVAEHVDGGTSRFDREGIVYQAVCADCGGNTLASEGFPVYPNDGNQNTYPKDNASQNCNNGLFKFDLANLRADFSYTKRCDSLIVSFDNLTLGGVDFEWIFGDGTDTLFRPEATSVSHKYATHGDYTVTLIATDLTTCVGKDTFQLSLNLQEILTPRVTDYRECVDSVLTLSSGYSNPAYTYKWFPADAVDNPNSSTTTKTVTEDDTITVTVRNSEGCFVTDSVIITSIPNLVADFSYEQLCDTLNAEFSNTTALGTAFIWYNSFEDDSIFTPNKGSIQINFPNLGNYTVGLIAYDTSACADYDTVEKSIEILEFLIPRAQGDFLCEEGEANVSSGYTNSDYSYQWLPAQLVSDPNASSTTIRVDTTTQLTITVTNSLNCSVTDTIFVEVLDFGFEIGYSIIGNCEGKVPQVNFYHNANNASTEWYLDSALVGEVPELEYAFNGFGKYSITGKIDTSGCVFIDSKDIDLVSIQVPNVFTPNNDGTNDTYIVKGIQNTGNWNLEVYNRWGKIIYKNESYDNSWNGGTLEDGTYYYLLTAPDESFCKGWVQILR